MSGFVQPPVLVDPRSAQHLSGPLDSGIQDGLTDLLELRLGCLVIGCLRLDHRPLAQQRDCEPRQPPGQRTSV